MPKGSFYNYFKNKEDFGLQVVDYFVNHFAGLAKSVLEDNSVSPIKRIEKLLDLFIDYFQSEGYARGCPIGNLYQEMGDLSPAFREKLKYAIDQMVQCYAKALIEAQIAEEIPETLDVREAAYFLVSSWHGALMRLKIVKDPEVHLTTGVSDPEKAESYLQIQGRAEILTDEETKKAVWFDHLAQIFSGPDDPTYCVCKVTPYRVEYQGMNMQPPEVWEP